MRAGLRQIASWILDFSIDAHLKMQVRTGASSGAANLRDDVAGLDRLTLGDEDFGAVGVESDKAAAVVDG